ncbi:MAG: TetR/AcrR family transcriptional regulator [Myxococcales bacterium]
MSRSSPLPRPRPVREQIREETQLRLLAAGEQVFAEQGVQAARVEDIAQRAGVAVGTLYNHFGDREGLLGAIARIRRAELVRKLDESMRASVSLPWDEQLAHFLAAMVAHFEEHRRFYALALQSEVATTRKNTEKAAALRDVLHRAEQLVLRGVRSGALKRQDHPLHAAFLVGMLRAALLRALREDGGGRLVDLVQPMVTFFLHGAGK